MVHHPLLAGTGAAGRRRLRRMVRALQQTSLSRHSRRARPAACSRLWPLSSSARLPPAPVTAPTPGLDVALGRHLHQSHWPPSGAAHPSAFLCIPCRLMPRSHFSRLPLCSAVWLPLERRTGDVAGLWLMGAGVAIYFTELWRDPEGRGSLLAWRHRRAADRRSFAGACRRADAARTQKRAARTKSTRNLQIPAPQPQTEAQHEPRIAVRPCANHHRASRSQWPAPRRIPCCATRGREPLARATAHRSGRCAGQRRPQKASLKLRGGEQIAITGDPHPAPLKAVAEAIPLDVVYEDADLAVVNKPAGMMVHAGSGENERRAQPWNPGECPAPPLQGAFIDRRRLASRHRAPARQEHQRPDHRRQERPRSRRSGRDVLGPARAKDLHRSGARVCRARKRHHQRRSQPRSRCAARA